MSIVYLVGSGPGDPDLLTLRAARLLRRADVVIHDALVHPAVLDRARHAILLDVGKRAGRPGTQQERIHQLLIEWSRRAKVIVRLKGGDPFLFGRGGEEALALRQAGVRFEVVPGITAMLGAAAYAGIPLTHRGIASRLTVLTGHSCDSSSADSAASVTNETTVCYMPVAQLRSIVESLISSGHSPTTPAALIESATYATQRTLCAPLRELTQLVERARIEGPALLIVGNVVALREQLEWFEQRNARRRLSSAKVT